MAATLASAMEALTQIIDDGDFSVDLACWCYRAGSPANRTTWSLWSARVQAFLHATTLDDLLEQAPSWWRAKLQAHTMLLHYAEARHLASASAALGALPNVEEDDAAD